MRLLPRVAGLIATLLAIGLSLYHLQAVINPQDPLSLRLIHLSLGMAIGFLTFSIAKKRKIGILDFFLAALAIVVGFYQIIFREGIVERGAVFLIPVEYIFRDYSYHPRSRIHPPDGGFAYGNNCYRLPPLCLFRTLYAQPFGS